MKEMKERVLKLLIEAKDDGISIHGDNIIGYFFEGEKSNEYTKKLKNICRENDQHWQQMSLSFEELLIESGINKLPYKIEKNELYSS